MWSIQNIWNKIKAPIAESKKKSEIEYLLSERQDALYDTVWRSFHDQEFGGYGPERPVRQTDEQAEELVGCYAKELARLGVDDPLSYVRKNYPYGFGLRRMMEDSAAEQGRKMLEEKRTPEL